MKKEYVNLVERKLNEYSRNDIEIEFDEKAEKLIADALESKDIKRKNPNGDYIQYIKLILSGKKTSKLNSPEANQAAKDMQS